MEADFYYDLNFDYENKEYPDEIWEILPLNQILLKTLTLAPVVLFGIFGNYMMLHTIWRNRQFHTPTNILIFNMAFSDLLVLIFSPAFFLQKQIFQSYKLGVIGCKSEGLIEISLLIASVITLCFISKDRLMAVAFPMEKRLNARQVKYAIATSWLVGLLLSFPLAIFTNYRERQWINFKESWCAENIDIMPLYWQILVIALMWIPLTVLVVCYSTIFYKLKQRENIRRRRQNLMQIQRSYKKKFVSTLFVVVISFVVLRTPLTTFVFIRYFRLHHYEINEISHAIEILWYISHYLIFVDCAVKPVIYGIMNENFRKAFRSSTMYRCCGRAKESVKSKIFHISNHQYELSSRRNDELQSESKIHNFAVEKF